LRGDSGTGKTHFVEMLRLALRDATGFSYRCEKSVAIISDDEDWLRVKTVKDTLFVLDDLLLTESLSPEIYKKVIKNDSYLLIINRYEMVNYPVGGSIDYSVNSILELKSSGNTYRCERVVDSYPFSPELVGNCDYVIAEDKYGSYDFLVSGIESKPIVVSSGGKDNIVNCMLEAVDKGYDSILLLADSASFGRYLYTLITHAGFKGVTIIYDYSYECFEYLLLMSNMFNKDFKLDTEQANKYYSWELYFEKYLETLVSGKMYKYKHGKPLRDCFLEDCGTGDCNSYRFMKCDKFMRGTKVQELLKGTQFEYLLSLGDGDKDDI
jgi:hypothetical protein